MKNHRVLSNYVVEEVSKTQRKDRDDVTLGLTKMLEQDQEADEEKLLICTTKSKMARLEFKFFELFNMLEGLKIVNGKLKSHMNQVLVKLGKLSQKSFTLSKVKTKECPSPIENIGYKKNQNEGIFRNDKITGSLTYIKEFKSNDHFLFVEGRY